MVDLQTVYNFNKILLGSQITAIVIFVGGVFFLYRLLVKVFEARLEGAKEEIDRLRYRITELEAQILSPSEALAQISIIKETSEAEKRRAEQKVTEIQKSADVMGASQQKALKDNRALLKTIETLETVIENYKKSLENIESARSEFDKLKELSPFKEIISLLTGQKRPPSLDEVFNVSTRRNDSRQKIVDLMTKYSKKNN